jgi:uncharacterized protein YaiE (UPF0345 family)
MNASYIVVACAVAVLSIGAIDFAVSADAPAAAAAKPKASGFQKIAKGDSGFETFQMFGSEAGAAKYLVRDDVNRNYVGVFRTDKQFAADNEWALDLDEYLTVTQGAIKIEFLGTGEIHVVRAGEIAYLPAGSRLRLTAVELPYAETFVMRAPRK